MKKTGIAIIAVIVLVIVGSAFFISRQKTESVPSEQLNSFSNIAKTDTKQSDEVFEHTDISLSATELQKLFKQARSYVSKNSAVGDSFDLTLNAYSDGYALFGVDPRSSTNDHAMLVMKNIEDQNGNKWEGIGVGTAWPDFEPQHPALFSGNSPYRYADYNFDGYIDRAEKMDCGATGNCSYLIELYDPMKRSFGTTSDNGSYTISSPEPTAKDIFVVINPSTNEKDKIICSFANSSASEFTFMVYRFSNDMFNPIREISVNQGASSGQLIKTTYGFDGESKKMIGKVKLPLDSNIDTSCAL